MANETGVNAQAIIVTVVITILFFAFTFGDYKRTYGGAKIYKPKTRRRIARDTGEGLPKEKQDEPDNNFVSLDMLIEEKMPPIGLVKVNEEIDEVIRITGIAEPIDSMVIIDDVLKNDLQDAALKIARKLSIMNPRIVIEKKLEVEKTDTGQDKVASILVNEGKEAVFGTTAFNYQTIRISVYPGYDAYPDKLIYVIAHELCHKILHSLDRGRPHNEKDERETDVAAVLLGFGNSYISAKNVDNGLGYLSTEEALFLKDKYSRILHKIKNKRNNAYRGFVELCQANEDKIIFLDALYKAQSLITNYDWEIDYATTGDDYNKLLVCTKTISVSRLKEYWRLCECFRSVKDGVDRYSLDSIGYPEKLENLKEIIGELKLPDFEYLPLLKKYQG